MERPFHGAASQDVGERLARLLDSESPLAKPLSAGSRVALSVGEVIHRMLEEWDLAADPEVELVRQRALLLARLDGMLEGEQAEVGRRRAAHLLDTFAGGELFERFLALGPEIAGREIPLLLPPGDGEEAPVGFLSGAVDMLYRDRSTGRLVIVDYKTDQVEAEEEIRQRAEVYAGQEAHYSGGIQEALSLEYHPAVELWFLWPDRMWTIS